MSGFRNYNTAAKNTLKDDFEDWRDSDDYVDEQPPATSVAQRATQMANLIPTTPPRPAGKPAGTAYASYLQKYDQDRQDQPAAEPEGAIPRTVSVSQRVGSFSKPAGTSPAPPPGAVQLPLPAPAKPTKYVPPAQPQPAAPAPSSVSPIRSNPPVAAQTLPARPTINNNPFAQPSAASVAPPPPQPEQPPRPIANNPFLQNQKSPVPTQSDLSVPMMPASSRRTSGGGVAGPSSAAGVGIQSLAQRFPIFSASEISAFQQQFVTVDKDGHNAVHTSDLSSIAPKAGESVQNVVAKLNQLRLVSDAGSVSFESFLTAVSKLREEKGVSVGANKNKIVLHGHSENVTHTINEDEKQSFVEHINQVLGGDKDISYRFPIDMYAMQIFTECKDGLILAKLINDSVPNTIDERVLNIGKKLNTFQMTENNNVVVNSAKAIGCSVVNIGAQDIIEGREHLVLGLIWQIIKMGLQAKIDIKLHPELFRLLEPGETLEEFLKLGPEQILLRWFNYHLKKAGWHRTVKNFSGDVKDAENYTVLLAQLAPNVCTRAPLQTRDILQRAEQVLENADRLHCRKYLSAKTLTEGNSKLNFAFVANLFNNYPGLERLTEAEMAQLDDWLFNSEGSREARAFALWLNSLPVDPFVNNLFDDCQDGLILLQAIDYVRPGLVDWRKVNRAPVPSKFKKVENTNYVIVLGKSLGFTLVGIQGSDITDGQKTLTLGLVWQLMREHVIQTLQSLSKSGVSISDQDIIAWANATVRRGGKASSITQFKDPNLRSGVYLLDLLNGIKKGVVNYELVTSGVSDESAALNAKYAISIARKLGATIFVLPDDIVEVKPKMILTFVGTLMALDRSGTIAA
ncbi:calponin homology domain-containing protein [Zopfochytrium polystomum]|nr:calponin homology domain-containing protein [Zopfochytrium polystomum]